MSKRTSSAITNGSPAKDTADSFAEPAHDKQKLLLSADTGHFSLIRALHLADAITLCNGASSHLRLSRLPLA
ncbi:uncharacterized protein ColSpa_08602 [Colletotrichum spaethianum]|uniref:Uncharacterized protein n=1 Tax=Colletotrichum spaethianum TaxID=700344 RepID=A0AA37UJN6_9PEZI|nr:uncharacterized protein ColSpa_08602 [Colletotrichum spaethianum]GKT48421.1 hypothetical protein ColSpa_08602 [Colletotrichum spaethianum]